MTTDLREALHALADTQTFSPDPGTWDRGRRARSLDHALRSALVVALVAALVGTGTLVLRPDPVDPAGDVVEGGAIPSRITDIASDAPMTEDLAIGRGSAAFVSGTGDPVVITATDGVSHRLELPGWDSSRRALALTADGEALAYQRAEGSDTVIVRLDLASGRDTVLHRQPGGELTYDTLSWSPGGVWLAWSSSSYSDVPAVGRVRPGRSRVIVLPFTPASVAVADDGALAIAGSRGGLYLPRDRERDLGRVTAEISASVGPFSPDGRLVALGTASGTASYTLDARTRHLVRHPFPDGTLGESAVRPLGWLDERLQVLLVREDGEPDGELVVTTPEVGDSSTWRRSVGSVASTGVANSLSLAVDLLPDLDGTSSQQLTHDFDAAAGQDRNPLGPTVVEVWLLVLLGAGVAVAVIALVVRSRRRLA